MFGARAADQRAARSHRSNVKQAGFIAIGVILGFVLGGIGPRRDLVERETQIAKLEEELTESRGSAFRASLPGFDRILGPGRERARDRSSAERPLEGEAAQDGPEEVRPRPPDTPGASAEPASSNDGGMPRASWRERWRRRRRGGEEMDEFRTAAEAQLVRTAQSRAALIEQAELTQEETAVLDSALRRMNDDLYGHGEEILDLVMRDEPPSPRDMLGVAHDVTGILHRGQLEIEALVGSERLANIEPSALEIWNYVDLDQLERAARSAARRNQR